MPRAMDPVAVSEELCAFRGRVAGSDAERRAARRLQEQLRSTGRDTESEPHWVMPHAALTHALHAALGVGASVLAVSEPEIAFGVLVAVLASLLLDASGRLFLLRRLTPRRATQNVVAAPRGEERPVRLVIAAHYDAPRTGLAYRPAVERLAVRLPRPLLVVAVALAALAAVALARLQGVEGAALGIVQLVPTAGLILAVALYLDVALSDPGPGANEPGSAAGAALALAEELDRRPLRALEVEVVLAGAGSVGSLGMRGYLRARRRWPRDSVVVLALGPCGRGHPRYAVSEGPVLPLRFHPRLIELCAEVAAERPHLRARPLRSRALTPAHPARVARLPAIAISCRDESGAIPGARQHADLPGQLNRRTANDVLELCVALVDRLDADVAARRAAG